MAIYDLTTYKIRVLLNPVFFNGDSQDSPTNMEGTVLTLLSTEKYIDNAIADGKLIDILCDDTYEEGAKIIVRWDNDRRNMFDPGSFIFRRGKIHRCNNIWTMNSNIKEDNRPYYKLHPKTIPLRLTYKHITKLPPLHTIPKHKYTTNNSTITLRGSETNQLPNSYIVDTEALLKVEPSLITTYTDTTVYHTL